MLLMMMRMRVCMQYRQQLCATSVCVCAYVWVLLVVNKKDETFHQTTKKREEYTRNDIVGCSRGSKTVAKFAGIYKYILRIYTRTN